jgi:hypothetical protein
MTCTVITDEKACTNAAECTYADLGKSIGLELGLAKGCVSAGKAKRAEQEAKFFDEAADTLKQFGANQAQAVTAIAAQFTDVTKDAAALATQFAGFGAKEIKSVLGSLGELEEKGQLHIPKDVAKNWATELSKPVTEGGLGSLADWTVDSITEYAPTITEFAVDAFEAISDDNWKDDTYLAAIASEADFALDQAEKIVEKTLAARGGAEQLLPKDMNSMKGVIKSFPKTDIEKITKATLEQSLGPIAASISSELGAVNDEALAAWGDQVYTNFAPFDEKEIKDLGALVATVPKEKFDELFTEDLLDDIDPSAILVNADAFAESLPATKLDKLTKEAKNIFSGDNLDKMKDDIEKVKAVVCDGGKCPGAICDMTFRTDGSESPKQILAKAKQACLDKGMTAEEAATMKVQLTANIAQATSSRRMRRSLAATATTQTVIRAETNTNAGSQVAAAAAQSVGATPAVVKVTATDEATSTQVKANVETASGAATTPSLLVLLAMVTAWFL